MSTKCPCRNSLLHFILQLSDHEPCSTGAASGTVAALRYPSAQPSESHRSDCKKLAPAPLFAKETNSDRPCGSKTNPSDVSALKQERSTAVIPTGAFVIQPLLFFTAYVPGVPH